MRGQMSTAKTTLTATDKFQRISAYDFGDSFTRNGILYSSVHSVKC